MSGAGVGIEGPPPLSHNGTSAVLHRASAGWDGLFLAGRTVGTYPAVYARHSWRNGARICLLAL